MGIDLAVVIEDLRRRNVPVPSPGRLPTEREVDEALERAGVDVHPDFRSYLLEASDVVVGTKEPVRIGGDRLNFNRVLQQARDAGIPADTIPLCEDNGDFFCVTRTGQVVYWSHDGATDETWPNIAAWIAEVWIGGG